MPSYTRTLSAVLIALTHVAAASADSILAISPTTFDFGWAPENAKISAEFVVKNTGADAIPLTSVQPTCGCTASNFTPGTLSPMQESKIGLTFNTRGYGGMEFSKPTKVKTDVAEQEYEVHLKGHVGNPKAPVQPVGNGIASFEPGSTEKKKIIRLKNTVNKDLGLEVVQKPADWANVKFSDKPLKAGDVRDIEISVDGSYQDERNTSITFAVTGGEAEHHLTLAIRTGPPPPAPRSLNPPAPPQPGAKPSPPAKP